MRLSWRHSTRNHAWFFFPWVWGPVDPCHLLDISWLCPWLLKSTPLSWFGLHYLHYAPMGLSLFQSVHHIVLYHLGLLETQSKQCSFSAWVCARCWNTRAPSACIFSLGSPKPMENLIVYLVFHTHSVSAAPCCPSVRILFSMVIWWISLHAPVASSAVPHLDLGTPFLHWCHLEVSQHFSCLFIVPPRLGFISLPCPWNKKKTRMQV